MRRKYFLLAAVTAAYFLLPFLHIGLALIAFLCIALPFALLKRSGRNMWCSAYCPRSHWLDIFGLMGKKRKAPIRLISSKARRIVLSYFCINLFFVTMSTIMVGLGRIEPMDIIRFFIVIPTDWRLPQLLDSSSMPPLLLHLSYRMYSVMLSSTIAGSALALFYKPRTWCAICPINTTTRIVSGN